MVLQNLELPQPKTKEMAKILSALDVDSSVLVVNSGVDVDVVRAARNIPGVKTTPANQLNVIDILSHKTILITVPAVRDVEALWGGKLLEGGSDAPVRSVATASDN